MRLDGIFNGRKIYSIINNDWRIPRTTKSIEVYLRWEWDCSRFGFQLQPRLEQDHGGFALMINCVFLHLDLELADIRHWNRAKGEYYNTWTEEEADMNKSHLKDLQRDIDYSRRNLMRDLDAAYRAGIEVVQCDYKQKPLTIEDAADFVISYCKNDERSGSVREVQLICREFAVPIKSEEILAEMRKRGYVFTEDK